ncbi:hypothetical protein BD410DRAFT_806147 [Rickenella mellea]|uniref:Uncharacterized protein n=1 Tax=Rickenella mellea TaxID=50990 RepID=A0A4Y7PTZ3_9AGAM|nr:hypothetical protein BD410DRAFT_806147 [Rickenella mellea]
MQYSRDFGCGHVSNRVFQILGTAFGLTSHFYFVGKWRLRSHHKLVRTSTLLESDSLDSDATLVDTSAFGVPQTVVSFLRDDMKNTKIYSADEKHLYTVDDELRQIANHAVPNTAQEAYAMVRVGFEVLVKTKRVLSRYANTNVSGMQPPNYPETYQYDSKRTVQLDAHPTTATHQRRQQQQQRSCRWSFTSRQYYPTTPTTTRVNTGALMAVAHDNADDADNARNDGSSDGDAHRRHDGADTAAAMRTTPLLPEYCR